MPWPHDIDSDCGKGGTWLCPVAGKVGHDGVFYFGPQSSTDTARIDQFCDIMAHSLDMETVLSKCGGSYILPLMKDTSMEMAGQHIRDAVDFREK